MNTTDKTLEMRSQPREKVFRWLEKSVADGTLKPGEAAPSVRDLAERLGIANGTAAAALRDAEARGVVVRRNAGAYKRFIPDHAAEQALATRSIFVIGRLGRFASGKPAPRWSDPYMAFELIPRLAAGGRHVMLLNGDEMQKEEVAGALGTHPAGVLVMGTVSESPVALETLRVCREAGIPAVVYGNSPALQGFDRVYTDHRAGSRMLAEWLLAHGRRGIVPFFPFAPSTHWELDRIDGYADAMKAARLKPAPCAAFCTARAREICYGDAPDAESFRVLTALALAGLMELRRQRAVDALLCVNDEWAKPVIAAIRALGLKPGRDIAVAGYDNIDRDDKFGAFESARPSITIDKHNERTAELLAGLLPERISGSLPPEPQTRTHAQELIVVK